MTVTVVVVVLQPPHYYHNHFMAIFLGPPRRAGASRELLDFMVQGKHKWQTHWPFGCAPLHLD